MKPLEVVWVFGVLGALILALSLFKRYRRRSGALTQATKVKNLLPGWVRQVETVVFAALLLGGTLSVIWLLRLSFPQLLRVPGAGGVCVALGSVLPMIPLAMLGSNLVSWLTPPLRKANLAAMRGSGITFWTDNRDLVFAAIAAIIVSLLLFSLVLIAPWR